MAAGCSAHPLRALHPVQRCRLNTLPYMTWMKKKRGRVVRHLIFPNPSLTEVQALTFSPGCVRIYRIFVVAESTDTVIPETGTSAAEQYDRVPPEQSGNGRAHIRPTFTHQRTGSSAHADPWSPGYQRNTSRFSLGGAPGPHARDPTKRLSQASMGTAHHRQSSSVTLGPSGPPVSKWQNFKRKFQGHRLREQGHKVPGWWASLKAIVTCSCTCLLFLV
jgi:hypothetical protein